MDQLNEKELEQISGGNDTVSTFTYEVVPGDSLSAIAMRFGTTVATLMALNKDRITNPDVIKVGWKLRVPVNTKKSGWM
ncbi:MAG: LysM domain-containing protein [Eubacteriales bacterium]|nr:LysM domain-containing protein [Eubacteriales bacterium]